MTSTASGGNHFVIAVNASARNKLRELGLKGPISQTCAMYNLISW